VLDLDDFIAWLSEAIGCPLSPDSEIDTELELVIRFDELVGDAGHVGLDVYECHSARDLHLYYLLVMSQPKDSSCHTTPRAK